MDNEISSLIEKQSNIIRKNEKFSIIEFLLNIWVFLYCFGVFTIILVSNYNPKMIGEAIAEESIYLFLKSSIFYILLGRIFYNNKKYTRLLKENIEILKKIKEDPYYRY